MKLFIWTHIMRTGKMCHSRWRNHQHPSVSTRSVYSCTQPRVLLTPHFRYISHNATLHNGHTPSPRSQHALQTDHRSSSKDVWWRSIKGRTAEISLEWTWILQGWAILQHQRQPCRTILTTSQQVMQWAAVINWKDGSDGWAAPLITSFYTKLNIINLERG